MLLQQTLLFVADDLRVPPCDDARGADAGKQILAGLLNCRSAFRVVLNANQLGALKLRVGSAEVRCSYNRHATRLRCHDVVMSYRVTPLAYSC